MTKKKSQKELEQKVISLEKEINLFTKAFRSLPQKEIKYIDDEAIKQFYFNIKNNIFGNDISILTDEEIKKRTKIIIDTITDNDIQDLYNNCIKDTMQPEVWGKATSYEENLGIYDILEYKQNTF